MDDELLTYRYPRTLQQAFGWRTSTQLEPMNAKKTTRPSGRFVRFVRAARDWWSAL